jgi:hypothetical protein
MEVHMATDKMISEKQTKYILGLANANNYMILKDLSNLSSREARLIIDFLKNGIGDYDTFRPVLRKRGPKIPNLVGDYLFEDNRTGERLR